MSASDLEKIQAAFTALDAAVTAQESAAIAVAKARKAVADIEALVVAALPVGKPVHIPGTRYTLQSDGTNLAIHEDAPVLTLEDLAK